MPPAEHGSRNCWQTPHAITTHCSGRDPRPTDFACRAAYRSNGGWSHSGRPTMSRLTFCSAALFVLAFVTTALPQDVGQDRTAHRKIIAAAPGRVEGSDDAVSIGASITGSSKK